MSSSSQIPVDSAQSELILEDYNSYPGCLPEFNPVAKPNEIFWSIDSDGVPIIIPTSTKKKKMFSLFLMVGLARTLSTN